MRAEKVIPMPRWSNSQLEEFIDHIESNTKERNNWLQLIRTIGLEETLSFFRPSSNGIANTSEQL
jgi:hypothetical protein